MLVRVRAGSHGSFELGISLGNALFGLAHVFQYFLAILLKMGVDTRENLVFPFGPIGQGVSTPELWELPKGFGVDEGRSLQGAGAISIQE